MSKKKQHRKGNSEKKAICVYSLLRDNKSKLQQEIPILVKVLNNAKIMGQGVKIKGESVLDILRAFEQVVDVSFALLNSDKNLNGPANQDVLKVEKRLEKIIENQRKDLSVLANIYARFAVLNPLPVVKHILGSCCKGGFDGAVKFNDRVSEYLKDD